MTNELTNKRIQDNQTQKSTDNYQCFFSGKLLRITSALSRDTAIYLALFCAA